MGWLSEAEFRQAGAEAIGVTINVAFLNDIKTDFDFREQLNKTYFELSEEQLQPLSPHAAANLLADLRDELETYFSLEEFYGYFSEADIVNPCVSHAAVDLRGEHRTLYLELHDIVELATQIAYREIGPENTSADVFQQFEQFCMKLARHEQAEMDLMMRLLNEDIGVGG